MGTTVTKTYSITVRYSKDDSGNLGASDLAYTELRAKIIKKLGQVVPMSQGNTSAHIVGSVTEA